MSDRVVGGTLVRGEFEVPGSKSYTHRALVLGALSGRRFRVRRPLDSEDTRATARGLTQLGSQVHRLSEAWVVDPSSGSVGRRGWIDCGESGTTLRFLLPLAARGTEPFGFRGTGRLADRPIEPLLDVLRQGGVRTRLPSGKGAIVEVRGPLTPVDTVLDPSGSSQFLSALLLTLPALSSPSRLRLSRAEVSRPYRAATEAVLRAAGVVVRRRGTTIRLDAPQTYHGESWDVPADASSAAYGWGAAAASGGTVSVRGIDRRWPQADLALLPWLRAMGATVRVADDTVRVEGPVDRPLQADLTDAPDLLPLVTALTAIVPGRSILRGATHASAKESDRRHESARLARALGATVELSGDRIVVRGVRSRRALRYRSPSDHRLVMSAAAVSAGLPGGSRVGPAEVVRKSFPDFWRSLGGIGLASEVAR